jgi:hypothetical protein
MIIQAKVLWPKFVLSVVLGFVGGGLVVFSLYPSSLVSIAQWAQNEGQPILPLIGGILTFSGLWTLFITAKQFTVRHLRCTKSPLVCDINNGLFEQVVERLWHEYFGRADLRVRASVVGHRLYIFGEVPESRSVGDEVVTFLSHRLLKGTGYWGEICLQTSAVP